MEKLPWISYISADSSHIPRTLNNRGIRDLKYIGSGKISRVT